MLSRTARDRGRPAASRQLTIEMHGVDAEVQAAMKADQMLDLPWPLASRRLYHGQRPNCTGRKSGMGEPGTSKASPAPGGRQGLEAKSRLIPAIVRLRATCAAGRHTLSLCR